MMTRAQRSEKAKRKKGLTLDIRKILGELQSEMFAHFGTQDKNRIPGFTTLYPSTGTT